MDFDTIKNGVYEVFRILAKVFILWNFTGDRIDFSFSRDIGEEDNPGSLRKEIDNIIDVLRS